jgi:hypothetical protein
MAAAAYFHSLADRFGRCLARGARGLLPAAASRLTLGAASLTRPGTGRARN